MLSPTSPRADQQRGAILLWMAVMMAVFLALAAFAVDLGMAYAVKRQLSATADAASLAGAQEGAMKYEATGGCSGGTPTQALRDAINAAVAETHLANAPWGSTGAPTAQILTCNDEEITVKVDEASNLGTFFARIMGISSLQPAATATANVFGSTIQGGLRPFTVCIDDARLADQDLNDPKATRDSIYVNHNSSTPTIVTVGSGTWSGVTIALGSAHNLYPGDWVEVVDNNDGTHSGFYYVESTPSSSSLTVTGSITYSGLGSAENVGLSPVPLDLYKITEGIVGDGNSAWAKNDDAITEPGHGLAVDDPVRVVVTAGATGASAGLFRVESVSGNTFTLKDDSGAVVDISDNGKADVYRWIDSGPTSSACSGAATAAAGNWGYARFDLGGDQTTLKCLVKYGYGNGADCDDGSPTGVELGDDDVTTPEVTSDGNTGDSIQGTGGPNSWPSILDSLIDEVIILPVAEVWNQSGSNAQYTAKGGIAVRFCGYMIPKNNNTALPPTALNDSGSCWDGPLYTAALANWAPDTSLYIQWRYEDEWVTSYIGQSDSAADRCAFGDATCIPVVRLIG